MTRPMRLQRKRTKGFKLVSPNGLPCVYVGRPSKWGNPYKVGVDGDAKACIKKYLDLLFPYTHKSGNMQDFMVSEANMADAIAELRGKNLVCFCRLDEPCHADALLKIVNGKERQ